MQNGSKGMEYVYMYDDDDEDGVADSSELYIYTNQEDKPATRIEKSQESDVSLLEIFFIVYLAVIFILACLSNTSILLAFFRKSSLRTTSNRFVIQLLIVNLLCCCMLLPLVLVEILFDSIPGQCILSETVFSWIASLSVLSTLLIGGDQYLAVKFPLRYRNHVTRTRACVSQVVVWLTSVLLALPWPFSPPPNSIWTSCPPPISSGWAWPVLTVGPTVLISFLLPVLTLTTIYCKIFREAHNNSVRTRRNSLNPTENLYNLTSTLVLPLTITQADIKNIRKISRTHSLNQSPMSRSEPDLERKGSLLYRSPSHIKANLSHLRHRISNASQIMQREEGRTARLYTATLTSILVCWSPYYLTLVVRLVPWTPLLPPWSLYLVTAPCFLYPLISPFIFACRNQKIRKELKRVFQIRAEDDMFTPLPPSNGRARRLARSFSMKEGKGPREVVRREGLRLKSGKDGQSLLVVRSTRSSFSSTTTSSSTSTGVIPPVLRYPRLEATC